MDPPVRTDQRVMTLHLGPAPYPRGQLISLQNDLEPRGRIEGEEGDCQGSALPSPRNRVGLENSKSKCA